MNILPQKYSEFTEKTYWNTFFDSLKHTQNEYFQWYGCYADYKFILQKIIQSKEKGNVFHVGCGKSTFTEDLWTDHPELNIINCDYSESIIQDMTKRSEVLQIKMKYIVCDVLKEMPQQYMNKFDVVLDKGTLDALLPEDKIDQIQQIREKYFGNMEKVLENGGNFVIISLLQPFVLRTILSYFMDSHFSINIFECVIKDSKMQPFLVNLSKSTQKQKSIKFHSLNEKKVKQYKRAEDVMEKVRQIQRVIQYSERIKKIVPGLRTKYNIFEKNSKLKYIIEIIDNQDKNVCDNNTCSVFIVPQGKQNSFTFDNDEGLKALLKQINTSRLLLAKLVTGNQFSNLEQVKKQLNSILPDLIQTGCNPATVPYLTDGNEIGSREYVYEDERFLIEEVLIENEPWRRLFPKSNLTQSIDEVKLTYFSTNNPYFERAKDIKTSILPVKKGMFPGIEKDDLSKHGKIIYSGISGFFGKRLSKQVRILVLGNLFSFSKFVASQNENTEVMMVIEEKNLIKIGQKYFDCIERENLRIVRSNLMNFLKKLDKQQKFDIIITDFGMNGNQNMAKVQELLEPYGLYICTNRQLSKEKQLGKFFFPIYRYLSENEEFLFCGKEPKIQKQIKSEKWTVIHKDQIELKGKRKPVFDWEEDLFAQIKLKHPNICLEELEKNHIMIDTEGTYSNPFEEADKGKKKKKGKKK